MVDDGQSRSNRGLVLLVEATVSGDDDENNGTYAAGRLIPPKCVIRRTVDLFVGPDL
jgi:hypothetical protein